MLDDHRYARILAVYRYPSSLPEGFLYALFSDVSEIAIIFREVERSKALSMVEIARRRRLTSQSSRVEEAWETEVLEELATRILTGSPLFEYYLLVNDHSWKHPRALC